MLTDLENGVTSLWLEVGETGIRDGDLPEVLADVLLDLAPVVLDAGADTPDAAARLMAVWRDRLADPTVATGNVGLDPLAVQARTGASADLSAVQALVSQALADHPRVRAMTVDALPYHDAGGSDAQELGCSLAAGVAYLRALDGARASRRRGAAAQLEFRYAATADQFLTIAKLRAARRLWARVAEVCGVPAAGRGQRQHAVTSRPMMTPARPVGEHAAHHRRLLRRRASAAPTAVTVLPFDAALGLPDAFSRRIARNTQRLLVEESHVGAGGRPGRRLLVRRDAHRRPRAQPAWEWFQPRSSGRAAWPRRCDSGLVG